MASLDSVPVLGQLRNATSLGEQTAALRHLKNQVIGHSLRKEQLVQHGLIDLLTHLLTTHVQSRPKPKKTSTNGSTLSPQSNGLSSSDEVRYQVLILIGSLAQGGPSISAPLIAAGVEEHLLALIHPAENAPKIVSAALKASLSLLGTADFSIFDQKSLEPGIHEKWVRPSTTAAYQAIFSQAIEPATVHSQSSLVCRLIQRTISCSEHQNAFCAAGLLDCIAAYIASYYVHRHTKSSEPLSLHPLTLPSPPPHKFLPDLLGAINAIVEGSRYRVGRLLLSPWLEKIFRFYHSQVPLEPKLHQQSVFALYDVNPAQLSIPWIHNGVQKPESSFTKAFPALGAQPNIKSGTFIDFADSETTHPASAAGLDTTLTSWLVHLMRTDKSLIRVRAARLLGSIARTEHVSRAKSHTLAFLAVPLLLDVMKSTTPVVMSSVVDPLHDTQSKALIEAPIALSLLIEESSTISSTVLKAACEAGIIKETCQYLKRTFDAVDSRAPMWSDQAGAILMEDDKPSTQVLGQCGVSIKIAYLFQCRRSGLILLQSIAGNRSGEDRYRRHLVDNGAVQCIVDSLVPFNKSSASALQSRGGKEKLDSSVGNPIHVLLAACKASTAISRSIYLLRTSLIDAGVSKPAYRLVQHPHAEVQIASLAVMCNLLVDCSPMRQGIIEDGAIPVLCAHARSEEPRIRTGALWAIKNLLGQAPSEIKQACLEELGINWLLAVIQGQNVPAQLVNSRVAPALSINSGSNALGERVSILNTPDDDEHMAVDSAQTSPVLKANDSAKGAAQGIATAENEYTASSLVKRIEAQHQSYLHSIKDYEDSERAQQPARDLNHIQAHALDILRNILIGPGEQNMVDYTLDLIGHAKLYDLLGSKMQPPTSDPQKVDAIPTKTLDAALKTLCHIAAGPPRHRAELISQTNLLQLLKPLFRHHDSDIRSSCCWVLTNLMWVDDSSDVQSAKERASMLKRMGFDIPLDELSKRPADGGQEQSLDVRERASAARDCMIQATEGRSSRMTEPTGLGHGVGLRA